MRLITFFSTLCILLFASYTPVLAQSTVQLSGEADYTFENNGLATAVGRFKLINLDTNTYPAVFFLELPDDATNVIVFDEKEPLEFSIVEEAGQKKAKIWLGDDAVGVTSEKNLTVSYKSNVFASQEKGIWHIYIPAFTTFESLSSYRVSVKLPKTWNEIVYTEPDPSGDLFWVFEGQDPKAITIEAEEHGFVLGASTVVLDGNMILFIGIVLGIVVFGGLYALFHVKKDV